jgi:hypothetical protein
MFYQAIFDETPQILPTQVQTQLNLSKMDQIITIKVDKSLTNKMLTAIKSNV